MKQTLFILLLIANISLFSQNTYVPDDNFEQALIDMGYDSGDLDDYVLTTNINEITYLNIGDRNISDLTGIEAFIALTELYCSSNQLTTLDVSANTALIKLYCGISQLTALDVSANTALTDLYCGSNQLTILDVSANTALTKLYCSSNQLIALDVSTNTALTSLDCYSNQLTALDIHTNTALKVLVCDFNQITALDVSSNTALTCLSCRLNQLTSLDVRNGNNAYITEFYAWSNPNLSCIYVDNSNAIYLSSWMIDENSHFVNDEDECALLSVPEIMTEDAFTIYPNPVKNQFTIGDCADINTVNIYNITGELVKSYNKQNSYSVSELTKGIYFVIINTNEGSSSNKLIVN